MSGASATYGALQSLSQSESSRLLASSLCRHTPTNEPQGLHLIEELPLEQRVVAHKQVLKFLNENPQFAALVKVIAVDEKGTVYVLDEKMENIVAAGAPSSIGMSAGK